MSTMTAEQIIAANKAAVAEAQALAATTLSGIEKLVGLQIAATKSALAQSTDDLLSIFSAQTPTDALAAQASLVKPLTEKTISYGRSVYEIASETSAEFTKVAEAKLAESQKVAAATLESFAKNAPAGSESVVAVIKSALVAGQNAVDTAKATAKKAIEAAEKQAAAVADTTLNAVKTTTAKKK
jgi:phasin family protein